MMIRRLVNIQHRIVTLSEGNYLSDSEQGLPEQFQLLLEHCSGGSLSDFLVKQRSLSVPLARHFTAEIILALEYLRKKEIVHRDLKPGNVVLDNDMHIKLIDFATCKLFNKALDAKAEKMYMATQPKNPDNLEVPSAEETDRLNSLVGTDDYLAPETIEGTGVSYASDLWSLGVMLFQLLTGKVPYKN